MRKIYSLLLLILLCCGITYAAGPDWTVKGNDIWDPELPGTASTTEKTHTNQDGNQIKIKNVKTQKNSSNIAFFLTKNTGVLTLEQFNKPVEKIVLWGMTQAAKAAKVNISDNGKELGSIALNQAGIDKSFELTIPAEKQTNSPIIKIACTNDANTQISKIDIYFAEGGGSPTALAKPTINLDNANKQFTISEISGGDIYYTVNQSVKATAADCTLAYTAAVPYETAEGTYYVHAYAKSTDAAKTDSDVTTVSYTVVDPSKMTVYSLVTDPSTVAAGDRLILVYQPDDSSYHAMGAKKDNNFGYVNVSSWVSGSGDNRVITIPADAAASSTPTEITVEANPASTSANYPFLLKVSNGYLHSVKGNNYLKVVASPDASAPFAIGAASSNDGKASISNKAYSTSSSETRYLRANKNSGNTLFSCYTTGQENCYIYAIRDNKEAAPLSWKDGIVTDVTLPYSVALTDLINNTENLEVSYSVAPESVLKIENGQLVALKEGTATLSVKYAGSETYRPLTLTKSFTVSKKESGIAWNETTEVTLNLNVATDVAEMISNPNNLTYTLTSSAPATIAVEGTVLTGKTEGTAQITIEYAGDDTYGTVKNQTRTFRVVNPNKAEAGLAWKVESPYSLMYESAPIAISDILDNPNSLNIELTSSDTDVIAVYNGNLKVGAMGTTKLKAYFAGNSNYKSQEITLTINVVADPSKTTTYTLLEDPTTLEPGQEFILVGNVSASGKYYAMGKQVNTEQNGAKYRDTEEVTVTEINGVKTIAVPQGSTIAPVRMLYYPNETDFDYVLKVSDGFLFASPTATEDDGSVKHQISTSDYYQNVSDESESRMRMAQYTDATDKCHFVFYHNTSNSAAHQKWLQFNASSPRFSGYESTSRKQDFQIYVSNSKPLTVEYEGGEVINGTLFGTTKINAKVTINGFDPDEDLYYRIKKNEQPTDFVGDFDWNEGENLGTSREFTIPNIGNNEPWYVIVASSSDWGETWGLRAKGSIKVDYVPVLDGLNDIADLTDVYAPDDNDIKGYAFHFNQDFMYPYAVNGSDLYVADDATERGHIKITNAPSSGEHGPNMIVEDLLCWYRADAKGHPYFDYIRATYNYDLYSTPEAIETEFASYEAAPENIYKYVTFKNIYVTSDGKLLADAPAASPARRAPAEGLVLNDIYGLLPGATTDNKVSEVAGFLEHFDGNYMFVPTKIGDTTVSAGLLPVDGAVVEAVYNLNGVKVNASDLATGIYIVRYSDGRTAKIVIRK